MRGMVRVLLAGAVIAGLTAGAAPKQQPGNAADKTAKATRAQQAYLAYCAMCHGPQGAGDGDVAASLRRSGITVPRLDDAATMDRVGRAGAYRIITEGGAHTGRSNIMPSWGSLVGPRLANDLADYVMSIPNQKPGVPSSTVEAYLKAPPGVPEEGRKLFVYHCSACHGPHGRGNGPSGDILRKKHNVKPRDLTDTRYLATKTDRDIYTIIALGGGHVGKSVYMPSWTVDLTPAQIKDLTAYVRQISRTRSRP